MRSSTGYLVQRAGGRRDVGAWLSLVERVLGVYEVVSSNLTVPTNLEDLMSNDLQFVKVAVPTFEIVDCPTINLKELRELGPDCPIRNQAMVDGEIRVFAPPTTVGKVLEDFKKLVELYEASDSTNEESAL